MERTENYTAFPSREVAWDEAVPTDVPQPDLIEPLDIPRSTVGEGLVVYDFGREFIGHIRLEIEAPAGGIVDVTNEELQRADGSVRMFQPNIAINPVDRLYLRPGVSHWEGFHARGGRLFFTHDPDYAACALTLDARGQIAADAPVQELVPAA